MLSDLPRHILTRVLSAEDATSLIGGKVPAMQATPALYRAGLWSDAETGEPVLGILPCPDLRNLRTTIRSVEAAFGLNVKRATSGNRNVSVTFGYRPRKPMMQGQEGCKLTAFNRDYPTQAAYLARYSEQLGAALGDTFPEIEVMGREIVEQVLPDWRLSDESLWTSGVINKESSLPYHRDGNNFDAWSVMPVIRRGVRGGHLHIPEYDIVVPCRDGQAVAFFGKRLVHGVTPMVKTAADGYRISVVYYALRGLKDCHTFAEETAYAGRRRAEREESIAGRASQERPLAGNGMGGGGAARFGTGARFDRARQMTLNQGTE